MYVIQTSYVWPADNKPRETGNAVLMVDPVEPMLSRGDRAVLFLEDITGVFNPAQQEFLGDSLNGASVYHVVRGAGQYRIHEGKVRTEKGVPEVPKPERRFGGKSESEVIAAAEARGKK